MRILKKYPNRRLYDTTQSCFVALEDVKRLVLTGEPFEVHDSKTGEDITRSVLLQIIAEQEADSGGSLLTDEVLRQLIRFYGDSLHGLLREYLERSVTGGHATWPHFGAPAPHKFPKRMRRTANNGGVFLFRQAILSLNRHL